MPCVTRASRLPNHVHYFDQAVSFPMLSPAHVLRTRRRARPSYTAIASVEELMGWTEMDAWAHALPFSACKGKLNKADLLRGDVRWKSRFDRARLAMLRCSSIQGYNIETQEGERS